MKKDYSIFNKLINKEDIISFEKFSNYRVSVIKNLYSVDYAIPGVWALLGKGKIKAVKRTVVGFAYKLQKLKI